MRCLIRQPNVIVGCLLAIFLPVVCLAFHSDLFPAKIHHLSSFNLSPRQLSALRSGGDHGDVSSESSSPVNDNARRRALQALGILSATLPASAMAGIAELDKSTGALYSPKSEMLSGGSLAARGIPSSSKGPSFRPQGTLQTVYETRFIAYLARFLLNFDPAANAWWKQQGFDSWDDFGENTSSRRLSVESSFAEFAESVEIGLADYFTGPYGSYSSPTVAKAGLLAAQPAPSVTVEIETKPQKMRDFFFGKQPIVDDKKATQEAIEDARQGILNLCALLQARYTTLAAKRQLAILFSFVSSPRLQPTDEIRALLGECDNACVSKIEFLPSRSSGDVNEFNYRTSSRRGGGYSVSEPPVIEISPPPGLGSNFVPAEIKPVMKPTSRVLRIDIVDGGEGYTSIPQVRVIGACLRQCQVAPILDREGRLESIAVLDPGFGYGGGNGKTPSIRIEAPNQAIGSRRARAVASLEYEIVGVKVIREGNGYIKTGPPKISISAPEIDPDWFLSVQRDPKLRTRRPSELEPPIAEVAEMRFPDGTLAYSNQGMPRNTLVDDEMIEKMQRSPLEMLPTTIRPEQYKLGTYAIPSLVAIPQFVAVLSPRYRACDPVFGGVGRVPVTKAAVALSASEYGRLALSGAVCTVLVRTALNPLELIKTKQQLLNDKELLGFASKGASGPGDAADVADSNTQLGTVDIARGMIELRGLQSLFQSADITFLASLVFGSLGFGATELFRRSFTAFFIAGSGVDEGGLDVVAVLAAASLATTVTAAAAAPFEVLRVRSMGLITPVGWTSVLQDFISQKSGKEFKEFSLSKLKPDDVLPLWAGFAPTVSRELPFAVVKFLTFDLIAKTVIEYLNSQAGEGSLPIQVGAGPVGLTVSALAGAIAGIAGAIVSHPADLILTKTSASQKGSDGEQDWKDVVRELLAKDGGVSNLFVGLTARSTFFFLVIGLQFFLYDYVKSVLNVGQDDLSLVLDVFYAVRAGLVGST